MKLCILILNGDLKMTKYYLLDLIIGKKGVKNVRKILWKIGYATSIIESPESTFRKFVSTVYVYILNCIK